jgi:hypothetical protein
MLDLYRGSLKPLALVYIFGILYLSFPLFTFGHDDLCDHGLSAAIRGAEGDIKSLDQMVITKFEIVFTAFQHVKASKRNQLTQKHDGRPVDNPTLLHHLQPEILEVGKFLCRQRHAIRPQSFNKIMNWINTHYGPEAVKEFILIIKTAKVLDPSISDYLMSRVKQGRPPTSQVLPPRRASDFGHIDRQPDRQSDSQSGFGIYKPAQGVFEVLVTDRAEYDSTQIPFQPRPKPLDSAYVLHRPASIPQQPTQMQTPDLVMFSPDFKLKFVSHGGYLEVFDERTYLNPLFQADLHNGLITSIRSTLDPVTQNVIVATTSLDGSLHLLEFAYNRDTDTYQPNPFFRFPINTPKAPQVGEYFPILDATFIPNTKLVIAGLSNGHVFVYNFHSGQGTIMEGHSNPIRKIVSSPNSRFFMTASEDHTVKTWELGNPPRIIHTFSQHNGPVVDLSWQGNTIVSASDNGEVYVRQALMEDSGKIVPLVRLSQSIETERVFSSDGLTHELQRGNIFQPLKNIDTISIMLSPDGKTLGVIYNTHVINFWRVKDVLGKKYPHKEMVMRIVKAHPTAGIEFLRKSYALPFHTQLVLWGPGHSRYTQAHFVFNVSALIQFRHVMKDRLPSRPPVELEKAWPDIRKPTGAPGGLRQQTPPATAFNDGSSLLSRPNRPPRAHKPQLKRRISYLSQPPPKQPRQKRTRGENP